jgi:autotransporter-associated beta strand protein
MKFWPPEHLNPMKKTIQLISTLICLALCGTSVQATTNYWDINAATAGAGGAAPAGAWDTGTTANWSADSAGGTATTTWTDNDDAVFSAGSDATGTFAISLNGSPVVGNLTVEEGAITISGGTALNVGGAATGKGIIDIFPNSTLTIDSVVTGGGEYGVISKGFDGSTGMGTLVLNGDNTYIGQTTVYIGTLSFDSIANVGGGASALGNPLDEYSGVIKMSPRFEIPVTLKYTGTGHSTDRKIELAAPGSTVLTNIITASGSGPLVFTSDPTITSTATSTYELRLGGTNTGDNKLTGQIQQYSGLIRFSKNDPGTWVLTGASDFSGVCDIREGTLVINAIADSGTPSPIGTGLAGAAHTVIGLGNNSTDVTNATLKYIGPGHASNRQLRMYGLANRGGGVIDASGTGPLVLNGSILRTTSLQSYDKTLILRGSNTGANTLNGTIQNGNNSKVISVNKEGVGTWCLGGVNEYAGATTISNGKLMGITGGSCASSAVTVETATTATLGVSITDNTKQWTCKSLTYSVAGGLTFAFANSVVPSAATAPLKVNGDPAFTATPTVTITHDSIPSTTASYPLMSYTGTASGTAPTTVTLTPALTGGATAALRLDTTGKVLYLDVTGTTGASDLNWGTAGNGNWDVGNSGNTVWKDSTTHASTYYQETVTPGDKVTFEDTDSGGGNHVITMVATIRPTSVTVNSANAYTISTSGSGVMAGSVGLTKLGTGTLTLNAANTYSGDTRIAAGKLVLANSSALTNSALDLGDGTLSFGSFTAVTLGGLKGTNNLALQNDSSAAVALSIGKNNGNTTYLGVLSGAGSFTKIGSGTFTWGNAGAQMTYSGNTTISQGTAVVTGEVLPAANRNLTVNGTLLYGANINFTVNTLSGNGTIALGGAFASPSLTIGQGNGSSSFDGVITRAGASQSTVTKVGTGTLTLTAGNSIGLGTGGFWINGGKAIAKTTTSALGAYGITVNDTGAGSATLEIVGMALDGLKTMGMTLGTNATLMASGGTSSWTRNSGDGPNILNHAQVTLSTATLGDTLTLGSAVSGGNASSLITVAGPGTIVLNGGSATGFNGKWRLTGGTLRLGNEGSLGNSGTKTIELAGGTVETTVNGNAAFSTATIIATSMTMTPNQAGAGADHNFGTLSINNSTLSTSPGVQITDDTTATISFTTTTLTGDATFNITKNGAKGMRVMLGAVGETGGAWKLIKNGDDRLNLTGASTYSGGATLNAGQLNINHAQALGTGTLTISGVSTIANTSGGAIIMTANNAQSWNADFTFGFSGNGSDNLNLGNGAVTLGGNRQVTVDTDTLTVGGGIGDGSNGYGLTKLGSGRLVLSGTSTFGGNTAVSGGTLLVNSPGSLAAASSVAVALGATLGGNGTINGPVTVAAGGTLSPGASVGTLTLNNDLTLSGNLLIEVNKSLSPSNDVVTVSGTLTNAGAGTVTVTNLNSGLPLAGGDSFQLFNKPVLNGQALTIVSAGGEIWTNKLAVDGSIAIVPTSPPQVPATNLTIVRVSPASFNLGGLGAANSAYNVYAATNVTTPMANWWLIGTTNSDAGGVIQFLDLQATNEQRFYRFGQ